MGVRFVLLGLCLFGCHETVSLGSECPDQQRTCRAITGARPTRDGTADLPDAAPGAEPDGDASTDDMNEASVTDAHATDDAEAPADAAPMAEAGAPETDASGATGDAGSALFPRFGNPSFEVIEGGSEGPLSVLQRNSYIRPWYACRGGMQITSSVTTASGAKVTPVSGTTFFADSFPNTALNLVGLAQDLAEPLHAGIRYAFAASIWSENGVLDTSSVELELVPSLGNCIPLGSAIASSGPVAPGAWRSVCLTFVPDREISSIMLMANAPKDLTNWGARLFVDDLRSSADCPP